MMSGTGSATIPADRRTPHEPRIPDAATVMPTAFSKSIDS